MFLMFIASRGSGNTQPSSLVFGIHNLIADPAPNTFIESTICGVFVHVFTSLTLLKLCTPVTYNSQVAPVCLNTASTEIDDYATMDGDANTRCRILGWGATEGKKVI